uniref:Uncharacterized protein n=1 Tax=Cynoglossus semilaevis TaxID=244447 RepID=A0A3P8WZM2_CYNSE
MVFLFREESCEHFMRELNVHRPQINQHIHALEEVAVQLDRMSTGAKISSVAGSSVGAVGGVLSIVGLALIPFTAGLSLGLTMTGVGLGVTSGVNSIVTTATEIGVNTTQLNKIREIFQNLMEDVHRTIKHQCVANVLPLLYSKLFLSQVTLVTGADVGPQLSSSKTRTRAKQNFY